MNFENEFSNQLFIQWIESFLPEFSLDPRKVDIPSSIKGVNQIQTLGESSIGVRVFIIETSIDPTNRKVGLAKESFSLIKNYGVSNALIAYYSTSSKKWRLSLLTSTPIWAEGKVIVRLSSPKRQSYVLGPQSKVNTPTRFLLKKDNVTDITDLKSRFSLEVVNKEFYKEISESFIKLVGGTLGTGRGQKKYEAILKLPSVVDHSQASIEFAVRLIGRIIFCWFLREKKSSDGTSLMPKELVSLEAIKNHSDYYHQVLEPIFFEVLNYQVKARKDLFYDKPYSLIPYLNGGLFSPHKDDFYKRQNGDHQSQFHDTLVIPDEWFVELFNTLETYNFTIDENTSFDEELSIDPEMLGRIFENLLAEINPETGESARKSTGSYYTPRVIVDYMVDKSLLLYLKQQTEIEEDKLRTIISYDLTDNSQYPLNETEKQKAIDALEKIKILDPACGSGAFPIGALQKMVFILQQIDPDGQLWFKKQLKTADPEFRRDIERRFTAKEYDYIRKLGLIRKCIYGVDIQPIATEISRLRCFLTLIVDQNVIDDEPNRGIIPLPNLDFKFLTANSLISIPQAVGLFTQYEDIKGIEELKQIREEYFGSSGISRAELVSDFFKTQKEIGLALEENGGQAYAEMSNALRKWDPFSHKTSDWFDPEWMFGIKEGFDIVIANPPYLGEKGHKELFREIKKSSLGEFYLGKMDLFYFFFHLALNIGAKKGIVTFITTNYYPTAMGAKKLRKDFKTRSIIKELINFNELKIFESAKGQHNMITILQIDQDRSANASTSITLRKGTAIPEILQQIVSGVDLETTYHIVNQKNLYDGNENYIRNAGNSEDSSDDTQKILNQVKSQSKILSDFCNINQGIVTGADKVSNKHINTYKVDANIGDGIFILSEDEKDKLKLTKHEKQLLRPWYKNSDVNKWNTSLISKEKVIYSNLETVDNIVNFSELYKHLEKFKQITSQYAYRWHDLHRSRNSKIFKVNKIVAPQRSLTNTFGYNEIPWYAASDVFFITTKDESISLKYILGLINSRLYYLWLYHRGKRKGETLELIAKPLSEIPIKKISPDEQQPFINIVDKILALTNSSDYQANQNKQNKVREYEKQIDLMVYELYGLSPNEIVIVEKK